MAILKEVLAITFAAGVLAAGVTAYLPSRQASAPEPDRREASADHPAGAVGAADLERARDRLRDALTTPGLPPVPSRVPVEMPPLPSTPSAGALAGDPLQGALASVLDRAPQAVPVEAAKPGPAAAPPDPAVVAAVDAKPPGEPVDRSWTPTPRPDLVARADALFDNGDVAGARFWLEAAVAAGDADAAFRLAETYDPRVLAEWRVIGMASDVARARALYERAMNGGVEAARPRMARLVP